MYRGSIKKRLIGWLNPCTDDRGWHGMACATRISWVTRQISAIGTLANHCHLRRASQEKYLEKRKKGRKKRARSLTGIKRGGGGRGEDPPWTLTKKCPCFTMAQSDPCNAVDFWTDGWRSLWVKRVSCQFTSLSTYSTKSVKGKCIFNSYHARFHLHQGAKGRILVRNSTRLDRPVSPRGRSSGAYLLGAGAPRVAARRGGGVRFTHRTVCTE